MCPSPPPPLQREEDARGQPRVGAWAAPWGCCCGRCCPRDLPAAGRPACWLWAQGLLWGSFVPEVQALARKNGVPSSSRLPQYCLLCVSCSACPPPPPPPPPPCTRPGPQDLFSAQRGTDVSSRAWLTGTQGLGHVFEGSGWAEILGCAPVGSPVLTWPRGGGCGSRFQADPFGRDTESPGGEVSCGLVTAWGWTPLHVPALPRSWVFCDCACAPP